METTTSSCAHCGRLLSDDGGTVPYDALCTCEGSPPLTGEWTVLDLEIGNERAVPTLPPSPTQGDDQ